MENRSNTLECLLTNPLFWPSLASDQPVRLCFMGNGATTVECMLTDPLVTILALKGPHLGPPMAPKGPHLAINRPLGALSSLGPTSWLVLSKKRIKHT